jgi:hypothetical protein
MMHPHPEIGVEATNLARLQSCISILFGPPSPRLAPVISHLDLTDDVQPVVLVLVDKPRPSAPLLS